MPGDYIRGQLKIDLDHPIIRVEVGKGGGRHKLDKSGKPTLVEMCDLHKQNCLPLITVGGGDGFGDNSVGLTRINAEKLKLGEPTIVRGIGYIANMLKQDKQIAYIEDGQMKYKDVEECREDYVDGAHGTGGCIDESSETYSRGSPGYVKISPEDDYEEVRKTIDNLLKDPNSNNDLIEELYPGITEEIKEEIRKELLGTFKKAYASS